MASPSSLHRRPGQAWSPPDLHCAHWGGGAPCCPRYLAALGTYRCRIPLQLLNVCVEGASQLVPGCRIPPQFVLGRTIPLQLVALGVETTLQFVPGRIIYIRAGCVAIFKKVSRKHFFGTPD